MQQLIFSPGGYGWVATDDGVRRYDGYAAIPLAQLLRPGSGPAPTGYVKLALDPAGQLWLGHETGLYRFQPASGQLARIELPQAPTERPAVDALWLDARTNRLWLGYGNGRLLCLDPTRPQLPAQPPASLTNGATVLSFAPATSGAVWATTTRYLLELDGRRAHLRQRYPSPGCFVVPVPGTRPQQAVSWQALFIVDSATGRLREQRRWLRGPASFDIRFAPCPDAAGRPATWLAQGHRIELCWPAQSGPALPAVRLKPLLSGTEASVAPHPDRLYSVLHGPTGPNWAFSPGFRGVYRERPPQVVRALPLARPPANPSVRGLARLPDGRLLVSTYGGAFTQAADSPAAPLRRWPLRYPAAGAPPLICYDLLVSRAGRVLFASEGGGFGEISPRTGEGRDFSLAAGSPNPALLAGRTLVQDPAGTIWGGTQQGLYQVDERRKTIARYRSQDTAWPLNRCDVRDLAVEATGTLWLATDRGLYAFSPATGSLRHYGPDEPLAARRLPTADLLAVLPPGAAGTTAWVATRSAGLLALHPRRGVVRRLAAAQGLPDAPVATLLPGPDGMVWAGTYAGLVRYAPAADQLTVYGPADGLAEPELNQQAALRDPKGRLYVGGIGGVYRITRAPAAAPGPPPRLLFTACTRADSVAEWLPDAPPPELYLPGTTAEAGVDLALTDFRQPTQARFYYQLRAAGARRPGPVRGTDRHLQLRGLAAGTYALDVWGQTATGQRSATRQVAVVVARPWWQHPVVLAAGVLLLVLAGAGAQGLRGRRARREARLRARIAADLHDEVGALLTRISMRAELLHETSAQATASPADATALLTDSHAALATMRDVVWSIDAGADTVGALLDRLRDHLEQIAEPAGWRTQLLVSGLPDAAPLPPLVRQHLYRLAKEAITNAVRHATGATEITVTLQRTGRTLRLSVRNDGLPATQRVGRSGLGLRSMQQRAHTLGAQFWAGPLPGGGWEVRVVVG